MDNLPKELIIEIFDYLNFKELCSLTETCKKFNAIISNTSTLINKFHFIFRAGTAMPIKKFRRIKIWNVNGDLLTILSRIGRNIYDIELWDVTFPLRDFKKILILCPELKNLKIFGIFLEHSHEDFNGSLPKLKLDSLSLYCDDAILKILCMCSVRKLELGITEVKLLKYFLKRQRDLEIIEFKNFQGNFELFNDDVLSDVEFRLRRIEINLNEDFKMRYNMENFKKFLMNQKSLSEVRISGNTEVKILDIFSEIPHVRTLILEKIPFHFLPMPNIENLTLEEYLEVPKNFNEKFRNVTNLTIKNCKHLKLIKHFAISPESEDDNRKFASYFIIPKVKTLTLNEITFTDSNLFDYGDIKIENLTIINCNSNLNWLINYLKTYSAEFNSLTIKDMHITRSQHQFLDSLNRADDCKNFKIKRLKLIVNDEEETKKVCDRKSEEKIKFNNKKFKLI